jgi:hypothetical protein
MTPQKLRQLADDADARALALAESGDIDGAARLSALAEGYRAVAAKQDGLKSPSRAPTVDSVMTDSHREALSTSRDLNDSAPMRAARKAGLPSLRAVAAKLDVDPGFLSKIFRGKRPCPVPLAEAFEKLTGFPATRWKR